MPVATSHRYYAQRTPEVQPNAVYKYEAPWREAEHQTFHPDTRDVFRHRTIHVDPHTTCHCVAPHTICSEQDHATASQPECSLLLLRSTPKAEQSRRV
jgi:hypothetical protein